ncbi:uncharacterized protein LOC111598977 [Drosophila hydei]|uniref:Uncharacterized protein LOC111598977 n=1 Tax=Drosophila hydei TaxID=7224 RepID=A0A6J1M131_DROHY|nr:uncharacterized protein LOC111598977 [Drosophila hydei]
MSTKTSSNSWMDSLESQTQELHEKPTENQISFSESTLPSNATPEQAEIQRIVQKTLLQMQDVCRFEDVATIMSLVVPKVLFDLHAFDQLHDEVQTIKQSLNSYIQHSKALAEDIAEIFLDLHNIYMKLDSLDRNATKKPREKKFSKRLREAEQFLENAKHYIINDKTSSNTTRTSPAHNEPKREKSSDSTHQTRTAERRAFLTNMIMVKKSDFSMELNRNKNYYTEAERVLKNKPGS